MNEKESMHGTGVRPIALVISTMAIGGVQRMALKLAAEFRRRGYLVDLVVVDPTGPLLEAVPVGVRLIGLGAGRARNAIAALRHYLRKERPSAVLSLAFQANLLTMIASVGVRPKPRIVLSVRNAYGAAMRALGQPQRSLFEALTRLLYPWADSIVAISHGMVADLKERAHIPEKLIKVIHNPVIDDEFERLVAQPCSDIQRDPEVALVVTVGRLVPQKDQATLIKAFARMSAEHPARLLLIGDGELRSELEELAESFGIRDRVEFAGFKSNPYPYMRAADLFVLSSAWEGFANVLVEAMATGTPVISTDCPHGPHEILEDGKWGILVPVGNADALATAMLQVLRNGGIDARERARVFTVKAATDKYLALLKELGLSRRAKAG